MASSTSVRRVALAAAALASVFVLSACAPGTSSVEHFPGLPVVEHAAGDDEGGAGEAEQEGGDGRPVAMWLEQGGKIAVTVWGSSTCAPIGERISVVEPKGQGNTVAISLKEYGDGMCTMDFVPHTTVFWTPMNITTTEELTVQVADTEVTVPVK
ncbi:hypothetical protein FLP10_12175 [Agromyces intestinalis]|uniref:Lipoprotein n=1 Tax=Agromyces intestinalis TaxID=2592652 RepID=A0A5C1YFW8_9MICO|nr:hypothetical protein [Agromyces intestinalis]QEO15086.1 hypothetical protein FLP10_12175 [Agromyces intestinalis]